MRRVGRRELLGTSTLLASALAAGRPSTARASHERSSLVKDPAGVLDLPAGFSYRVLSRTGDPMSDGYRVPGKPDAMGTFSVNGDIALMRNHEVQPGDRERGPYPPGVKPPAQAYDAAAYGGVTRVLLDAETLQVKKQQLMLCGTHWNCAGGLSPWGWLSCEELFIPGHGYVFLVPADSDALVPARKIPQYGRFRHEAATVDPRTHIAYLTEDREDAAFYRFAPDDPGDPFRGKLQALRVVGHPAFDTSAMHPGQALRVDWVDVPNPDSEHDDVRHQAHDRGAARFARTEGIWLHGPELFMSATAGGPIGRGQIFRLQHAGDEPQLSLVVQSTDPAALDMPDNLTVAPNGELYVAEDGYDGNYIRRVTPAGEISEFGHNALSSSEFAGPCFSPDGRTLFVNIQHNGLTLAIRGPFGRAQTGERSRATHERAGLPRGAAGIGGGLAVLALAALAQRKRKLREGA